MQEELGEKRGARDDQLSRHGRGRQAGRRNGRLHNLSHLSVPRTRIKTCRLRYSGLPLAFERSMNAKGLDLHRVRAWSSSVIFYSESISFVLDGGRREKTGQLLDRLC